MVRAFCRAVAVAAFPVVEPELPVTFPVTFPVIGAETCANVTEAEVPTS